MRKRPTKRMLDLDTEALEQYPVLWDLLEEDYYDRSDYGWVQIPWDHKNMYLVNLIVPAHLRCDWIRKDILNYNYDRRCWQIQRTKPKAVNWDRNT